MKNYRLKSEAVPFINEKHATNIYPMDTWDSLGIDINALEEVKPTYLKLGHAYYDNSGSTLGGWDKEGAKFHFTIHFPGVKHCEYDKFSKGKMIRNLMDIIQSDLDSFYSDFVNENVD